MSGNPRAREAVRSLKEGVSVTPDGSAPALRTVPPGTPARQIIAIVEADGGVIVRDFLSADALGRLQSELQPFVDGSRPGSREAGKGWQLFHGSRTRRF